MESLGRCGGTDFHRGSNSCGSYDAVGGVPYAGDGAGCGRYGGRFWGVGDAGDVFSRAVRGGACMDAAHISVCA